MNQLDKLLKTFDYEIRQLISKEDNPREFYLLKNDEKGKLTHLVEDVGRENLEIIYNRQIIEVYYNPFKLTESYIRKPNITDEILVRIFKYLAHHEYGHSRFSESTLNIVKFKEKYKDSIFENYDGQTRLNYLFWILFRVLRESYADFQAKKNNPTLPEYFLDLNFKAFEQFLSFNRMSIISGLFEGFYSKVLYSSTWFYNFNQWDYLLKKCGENDKTKSLNLILSICNILEVVIKKNLNLDGYRELLIQLALLLWKINYNELFFENKIDKDITSKLEDFLTSI